MSAISPQEITTLPRRYAIGKRPLSLLLGWGELTYTRLLEGKTPTTAHAAELRRLFDDPAEYARVLENGRDRITEVAYRRSYKAVDELLADQGGAARATRIFAVADRLCSLADGDLTPSALQRLTYYAQGLALARLDDALFDDLPYAREDGPAYERIEAAYSFDEIQAAARAAKHEADDDRQSLNGEVLTNEELRVVDTAYSLFGGHSGQALSKMSRDESPWRKACKRAKAKPEEEDAAQITAKSMRKFFLKTHA